MENLEREGESGETAMQLAAAMRFYDASDFTNAWKPRESATRHAK